MKKLTAAAVVSLMVAGCAHAPIMKKPQVNRAAKADKLVVKTAPETPAQQIKKRWRYFAIPKWLHK
jgi:hypothetical protein